MRRLFVFERTTKSNCDISMSILLIRDVDTISMGRSILSFRGNRSTFVNYPHDEFISLFFFLFYFSKPSVQTLIKSYLMRHFIWVFTVCEGICLSVSSSIPNQNTYMVAIIEIKLIGRLPPAIIGQSTYSHSRYWSSTDVIQLI